MHMQEEVPLVGALNTWEIQSTYHTHTICIRRCKEREKQKESKQKKKERKKTKIVTPYVHTPTYFA